MDDKDETQALPHPRAAVSPPRPCAPLPPEPADGDQAVVDLVLAYGVSTAPALFDAGTALFRHEYGVIGYRDRLGCTVALGDPVAAPERQPQVAAAFRDFCRKRGRQTVYAVVTAGWADWAAANGYGIVAFGRELSFVPHPDPLAPPGNKMLRKKVRRARRHGVAVTEYHREQARDTGLERELDRVVAAWLGGRSGVQFHLGEVMLWTLPLGTRWFYAAAQGRPLAVAVLQRLDRYRGYLLWQHAVAPGAPPGTTEALLTTVLATLGREGVPYLSTGASAAGSLEDLRGLGTVSTAVARGGYRLASRVGGLEGRIHYLRKFGPAREEPVYLACRPPRIGPDTAVALMSALNGRVRRPEPLELIRHARNGSSPRCRAGERDEVQPRVRSGAGGRRSGPGAATGGVPT